MKFVTLENTAKDFVNNSIEFKSIMNIMYITQWLEQKFVKLVLLYDLDTLKTFVLLTKMNKDPLKIHENPYNLEYIYTFDNYRRQGFAYNTILELKKNHNITAFCTDNISEELFKKAKYIFLSYDPLYNALPIYRFP